MTDPEITVCIFGWNESGTAASFVRETIATLEALDRPFEIVFIDDGSTDGTPELVEALVEETPALRVLRHGENRGVGPVYRAGLDAARGRFLSFLPADAQFPSEIVADFYRQMDGLDLMLGYLPERSDIVGRSLSAIERTLYRALLGPMPRFQGIFMVRTSVLKEVSLVSQGRGWAIVMELILRVARGGYRVRSAPTEWRPRVAGHSKVNNWRNIQANMRQLLTLRKVIPRGRRSP